MTQSIERRPLLAMNQVTQTYALPRANLFGPRPSFTVLQNIDFDVCAGEAVGLVGESGAGKTTLTRILTGMEKPQTGSVTFEGADIWSGDTAHRAKFRRSVQMVLQNPRSSLDPRMRVGTALLEPMRSLKIAGDHTKRLYEVLDQVGLDRSALERYPHEFSGGQLQRVAIARALMPNPRVLVADEPVSALDVSIQAQVLNLLKDLVRNLQLGLVFIAHDLSVVAYTTSRVSVIAAGRIVEVGQPIELFTHPKAPETKNLVDAVLTVEAGLAGTAL
ncbi:dipeptide/oligopeptide/nickel ABC transporter ATP-binding protein [Devosia sp. SD17-2]|jgi:ABC-type oligopeptide transport system ATPase subunit|uniref:ABC transporter ATP-binding protein n=1 Tax=Devosia sp. SD17-2 TaxID=2976459 RepID=UPI0023D7EC4A|nr:dipeptide/oligopeptide/nickel ABC transporter ATP-binding protein [Devosia sp. SD17-2]WEJ34540.1 dipeptide/oligopeptide/nickel ABC transporter ATP-binding protein [Devosia sp. SD17-2]